MRLIDADALIAETMKNRCADCDRRKGIKQGKITFVYEFGEVPCRACDVGDMIDTLDEAPTVGGWISVKERLPENSNEVITAYKIDDEKAMKKRKGKLFVKTGNWTGSRWISVWDEYKSYATEEEVLY